MQTLLRCALIAVMVHAFFTKLFVLAMMTISSTAQLTDIAGTASVSLSPNDATCGLTSADSYCLENLAADASCVVNTCRTTCTIPETNPSYRDLMDDVIGFNYDNSVTDTTKDFGSGNVTVAVFNRPTIIAFLRGTVNMTTLDEFTLTFWIRPDDMDAESSVIDIHGTDYEQSVLNIRLGADLGLTIVSGSGDVTDTSWRIPLYAWSHVAMQFGRNVTTVYLNGTKTGPADVPIVLHVVDDKSQLNVKIGQSFAGDLDLKVPILSKCVDARPSTEVSPDDHYCQGVGDRFYSDVVKYWRCSGGRLMSKGECRYIFSRLSCHYSGSYHQRRTIGCDPLNFKCLGERRLIKTNNDYCDEYFICDVSGDKASRRICDYPDRWSIEHRRCEALQMVNCGRRIPKYHPCDRRFVFGSPLEYPAACYTYFHPNNCTGKKNGLYYIVGDNGIVGFHGCINYTLVELYDNITAYYVNYAFLTTYYRCPGGYGINSTTGRCDLNGDKPVDHEGYVPDSPYLWCTDDDVRTYKYDCRNYWLCDSGQWIVVTCPVALVWSVDENKCVSNTSQCGSRPLQEREYANERQFLGYLAATRIYTRRLSQGDIYNLYDPLAFCKQWGAHAHPVAYVIDTDPSTYWLSRAELPSVNLTFELKQIYTLEEISLTFFGPVPLVVSIFKKVTTDDSWQLWRVFRDDCSGVSRCTKLSVVKRDGERLTYNLLDVNLGPLQRRTAAILVRLSGHRYRGAVQLHKNSYFGLYSIAISRRKSSRCGSYTYLEHGSSRTCLPCGCDVRGVIGANVECNQAGGQCACKQYVTGRRCDQCLSGYRNIRKTDPDGCSETAETSTLSVPPTLSVQWVTQTTSLVTIVLAFGAGVVVITVVVVGIICIRRLRRRQSQPQSTTANRTSLNDSSSQAGVSSEGPDEANVYTELSVYESPVRATIAPTEPSYTELTKPRHQHRPKRSAHRNRTS